MLCNKSWLTLRRKMISILTGLKVSSLACKCVFYRPEHNAKEEMKYTKGQNSKEKMRKMGSFVKLSCFNPRVMVIKMSKMAYFCIVC